ncbi:phosphatase PAP2 family protein [Nocardioides sp. SYSU D00065]|uniref:phosphatase PAP2 family protein n=1 Tax=Nocardioides sp. SYSU D00065 TaxID=2817378 RepID=UPI0027DB879F|nr:phosphatase PAP2 family protein [Nocardioides sp. SYSU D00065]
MTPPPARRAPWILPAVLATALLVLSIAVAVEWSPLMRLDRWVAGRAFEATSGHDGRIAVWTAITDGAAPHPVRLALLVAAVLALVRRRVDLAVWLAALSFVEGVVAPASKHVLDRPRPSWAEPVVELSSLSYPSGHATAAATAAVALVLVVRHRAAACAALVLAVSVAASRVFLGVHYLSDVVAGSLLGSLLAVSTYAVLPLLRRVLPTDPRSDVVGTADRSNGT